MNLKLADFMVAAQQLSGKTPHLISQGCRIEDGLGFAFRKTTQETKLLRAHQLSPHHESCCSGWNSLHSQWALPINLVRNMQQGFSQLHFPASLTPCTSKTPLEEKNCFESPFEEWEWGSACRRVQVQRDGSLPDTFLRNVSLLISTARLSGDLWGGMSSAQSCFSAVRDYRDICAARLVPIWLNSLSAPSTRYQRYN